MKTISRMLFTALAVVVAATGSETFATPATVGLKIQSGTNTVTIFGPPNQPVQYNGAVGGWNLNVATGLGPKILGPGVLDLSFVDTAIGATGTRPSDVASVCNQNNPNYAEKINSSTSSSKNSKTGVTTTVTTKTTIDQAVGCNNALPANFTTPSGLTIWFSATNLSGKLNNMQLDFGGTNSNSTAKFAAYFDTSNHGSNSFTTPALGLISATALEATSSFSETDAGAAISTGKPYSLTEMLVLNAVPNSAKLKGNIRVGSDSITTIIATTTCTTDKTGKTTCGKPVSTTSNSSSGLFAPQYQYTYSVSGDAQLQGTPVPEPSSLVLLGTALSGLVLVRRRLGLAAAL